MPFDPNAFIAAYPWRFAKTYAKSSPHEYVVRYKDVPNDEFVEMVNHIRANGQAREWRGKLYVIWYAEDGQRYWTMGWPVSETTIINRGIPDTDETNSPNGCRRWSSHDGQPPEGFTP